MKQSIGEWLATYQGKLGRGLPFHWGGGEIVLALILILGILSLGSGMVGKWINAAGDGGILPVSLHSLSEADYSVDEILYSVPVIGLDIIRDLLGMNRSPETGESPEIAVIIPLTPTLTSTVFGSFPSGLTPTTEVPIIPTATDRPASTATPNPRPSATSTSLPTLIPTNTPSWTDLPPVATETKTPTATPRNIPTNTTEPTELPPTIIPTEAPTNTPLPIPTNTPLPAPTNTPPNPTSPPPPANSPTPRPTRSSTLAVTPTAHYTPVVTGDPSVDP